VAPWASTPAANFEADFSTIVAGFNITPRWDAVASPPPLQPHCSATRYDIFLEFGSNNVANTDADADSTALVNAVSLTQLSQTDPLHPSNDEDGDPNKSPGDATPCAICAALCNHGTAMDAVLALEPQTPDDMVASYFHTIMATINHHFSGIQRQMATTITNSIRDVLEKSPHYMAISRCWGIVLT
jgi:hypothetical protein